MLNFILSKIDRKYDRAPQGADKSTAHADVIKAGDIVEYAILFSQNIRYRVEEIQPDTKEARIRVLNADGSDGQQTYLAPMQMLRHPHKNGSK
jgi:hypothetical protein